MHCSRKLEDEVLVKMGLRQAKLDQGRKDQMQVSNLDKDML